MMKNIICPICQFPLTQERKTLKCPQFHSFDLAREGYVNLLQKPWIGDTKVMLQDRRKFLERDLFCPLAKTISEIILQHQVHLQIENFNILDAGCGEGYYLRYLQSNLDARQNYIGIDVSKDAIRMAAKAHQKGTFIVANLKEPIPFASNAIDIVLSIFAPKNPKEFARMMVPAGLLIVVIPQENHLQPLTNILELLSIDKNKYSQIIDQFKPCFDFKQKVDICYSVQLTLEEIELVVNMGPNAWHKSTHREEKIANLQQTQTTMSFSCLLFQKKS